MSNALSNVWSKIAGNGIFGSGLFTSTANPKTATTSEEDTAIEDKKAEQASTTSGSKALDFDAFKMAVVNNLKGVIYIIIVGAMGVFFGKVAQANILPDNVEYSPYTDKIREVEPKLINSNVVKVGSIFSKSPKIYCTKIEFPVEGEASIQEKMANSFIFSKFKDAQKPKKESVSITDAFKKYISDVLVNVYPYNFMLINTLFGAMNENLSESAIYILFPLFFGTLFFSLFFMFNLVLIVINLFFYLTVFFQYYDGGEWASPGDDPPEGYNWWIRLAIMLVFVFLALGVCIIGLPLVTMVTSLSMALSLKADVIKVNGADEESTGEKFGFITALLSNILYKGQLLMALFSFDLIIDAFTYLNNNYGVGCIIAILFLYFVSPLFKQYNVAPSSDNNITECKLNGEAYEKAGAYNKDEKKIIEATSLTQKTKDWTKSKTSALSSGFKKMTSRSNASGGSTEPVYFSRPGSFDESLQVLPSSSMSSTPITLPGDNSQVSFYGGKKLPKRKGVSEKK